jgi:hypothetical protein
MIVEIKGTIQKSKTNKTKEIQDNNYNYNLLI